MALCFKHPCDGSGRGPYLSKSSGHSFFTRKGNNINMAHFNYSPSATELLSSRSIYDPILFHSLVNIWVGVVREIEIGSNRDGSRFYYLDGYYNLLYSAKGVKRGLSRPPFWWNRPQNSFKTFIYLPNFSALIPDFRMEITVHALALYFISLGECWQARKNA